MANKKKLIQNSKTLSILEDYSFVLFLQQPQQTNISLLEKVIEKHQTVKANSLTLLNQEVDKKTKLQLFRYKNTIIKKCISDIDGKREKINAMTLSYNVNLNAIFQGPNLLIAGNDLEKLPLLWKSINSIPHLFFCGAIVENTVYNKLDFEKSLECVYNSTPQDVYNKLVFTLNQATQINSLSVAMEYKLSAIRSSLCEEKKLNTINN